MTLNKGKITTRYVVSFGLSAGRLVGLCSVDWGSGKAIVKGLVNLRGLRGQKRVPFPA